MTDHEANLIARDTRISDRLNGLAIALSPIIVLVLTGLMLRAV